MSISNMTDATSRLTGAVELDLAALGITNPNEERPCIYPFSVSLTRAAATTAVDIVPAAAVGTRRVVLFNLMVRVGGATDWSGSGSNVLIQDTADTPVVGVTIAKAGLTGNAKLTETSSGLALAATYPLTVFTAGKGVQIVADGAFSAGSTIACTGIALLLPA